MQRISLIGQANRKYVQPIYIYMPCPVDYVINTNYRYGLWSGIAWEANLNVTSLLGSPINQTIQTLIIEPPVAFVSTITNLNYPTIDFVLLIQIDMVVRFNNYLKIESYDVVLSWGYSEFEPMADIFGPGWLKCYGDNHLGVV